MKSSDSTDQIAFRRFAELASPHAWLQSAESLHEQAFGLSQKMGKSATTEIDGAGCVISEIDDVGKACFLLSALAIENLIKAFLVYEFPHWISNGRLSKELKSHELRSLRAKSSLVPNARKFGPLLTLLEDGFESWARYPCGLSYEINNKQVPLSGEFLVQYNSFFVSHRRKIETLLSNGGWQGPHGLERRFYIFQRF